MRRIERIVRLMVLVAAAAALGVMVTTPAAYAQSLDTPQAIQPPQPQMAAPEGAPPVGPAPDGQGWAAGQWQGARPVWQGRPMANQWQPPMAGWQGQPGIGPGRGWAPAARQRPMRPMPRQLMNRNLAARRMMLRRPGLRVAMTGRLSLQQQLFRGIRLDEAQRARVREINQKHQATLQALNRALGEARRALNQARAADTFDEAALRKGASAMATAEADLAVARNRLRTDLLSVLTPEQQKTVAARRQLAKDRLRRLQELRQPPQAAPAPQKKD